MFVDCWLRHIFCCLNLCLLTSTFFFPELSSWPTSMLYLQAETWPRMGSEFTVGITLWICWIRSEARAFLHQLVIYIYVLVGGWPTPSEKNDFVSWDDAIPNIWKVIKFMFQTTNQHIYIYMFIVKSCQIHTWWLNPVKSAGIISGHWLKLFEKKLETTNQFYNGKIVRKK
jgi:hypothetical protein